MFATPEPAFTAHLWSWDQPLKPGARYAALCSLIGRAVAKKKVELIYQLIQLGIQADADTRSSACNWRKLVFNLCLTHFWSLRCSKEVAEVFLGQLLISSYEKRRITAIEASEALCISKA